MKTIWAGTVRHVAIDLAHGDQVKLDHEDVVTGPDGKMVSLHEIPDALTPADAYIDYTTESRWQRDTDEDWKQSTEEWQPAKCRVYARHVVEVLVTYADD